MAPKRSKPTTTPPKLIPSSKVGPSPRVNKPARKPGPRTKTPSILTQMATKPPELSIDAGRPKKARVRRESVLARPTMWAKRMRGGTDDRSLQYTDATKATIDRDDLIVARMIDAGSGVDSGAGNANPKGKVLINGKPTIGPDHASPRAEILTSNAKPDQKLLIMHLPREIRDKIWHLAVVRREFFVDPTIPTGSEQPDLAMTCRFIRGEVLPIFYAENTFRIEASDHLAGFGGKYEVEDVETSGKTSSHSNGFAKWAAAVEKAGWFSKIRRWCFECYGPRSLIEFMPTRLNDRTVMVSLILKRSENNTWGAGVEVHVDVRCVLPGLDEGFGCIVKKTPVWLNEAVIELLDAARGGAVPGAALVKLSKALQDRARDLVELRCTRW